MFMLKDEIKSEPEESPIDEDEEPKQTYPDEFFNLATLAEVSLAYAESGNFHSKEQRLLKVNFVNKFEEIELALETYSFF